MATIQERFFELHSMGSDIADKIQAEPAKLKRTTSLAVHMATDNETHITERDIYFSDRSRKIGMMTLLRVETVAGRQYAVSGLHGLIPTLWLRSVDAIASEIEAFGMPDNLNLDGSIAIVGFKGIYEHHEVIEELPDSAAANFVIGSLFERINALREMVDNQVPFDQAFADISL